MRNFHLISSFLPHDSHDGWDSVERRNKKGRYCYYEAAQVFSSLCLTAAIIIRYWGPTECNERRLKIKWSFSLWAVHRCFSVRSSFGQNQNATRNITGGYIRIRLMKILKSITERLLQNECVVVQQISFHQNLCNHCMFCVFTLTDISMSSSRRSVIYILVFMISYLWISGTDRRPAPKCLITLESCSLLTVSPLPVLASHYELPDF